jgi:acetyltransferase-like isoleucine patch superfamily enzyme
MRSTVDVGDGLRTEPGVVIGYAGARNADTTLRIGNDAHVRSGSTIYLGSQIGDRLSTGHGVVIRESCQIGDDVSIWTNSVVDYGCRIGSRVKIHTNCYVAQYTELLDGAFLAPGVTIANDLYPGDLDSARTMSGPLIGEGAQLGVNVTVLPFVRIGDGALIGAGSVVTRDIPAGAVAYGNPAQVRGSVEDLVAVQDRVEVDELSASRFRLLRSDLSLHPNGIGR